MVAEVFLPGPEPGVGGPARSDAFAGAVRMEPERVLIVEVVRAYGDIAGVSPCRRSGAPEQPRTDAPLVVRHRLARQVAAGGEHRCGRLDPRGGRDVAVAHRR